MTTKRRCGSRLACGELGRLERRAALLMVASAGGVHRFNDKEHHEGARGHPCRLEQLKSVADFQFELRVLIDSASRGSDCDLPRAASRASEDRARDKA